MGIASDGSGATERTVAKRMLRTVPSLSTQALRVSFLRTTLQATSPASAARALDELCWMAEGGDPSAREVLVGVAAVVQEPQMRDLVDAMRACAEAEQLGAIHRLLQRPDLVPTVERVEQEPADDERRVPDYGRGRPLTLGERKALARRPARHLMDKLLADPHPHVIRNLLDNAMTTEDDIVRLAARRPLSAAIMREIARHPKWNVRRRVRMAMVLNPGCPRETGLPLVGLLLRSELKTLVQMTEVHPDLRAAASERLRRVARGVGTRKQEPGPLN